MQDAQFPPDADDAKRDPARRSSLRLSDAEAVATIRRDMFGDGSLQQALAASAHGTEDDKTGPGSSPRGRRCEPAAARWCHGPRRPAGASRSARCGLLNRIGHSRCRPSATASRQRPNLRRASMAPASARTTTPRSYHSRGKTSGRSRTRRSMLLRQSTPPAIPGSRIPKLRLHRSLAQWARRQRRMSLHLQRTWRFRPSSAPWMPSSSAPRRWSPANRRHRRRRSARPC